LSESLAIAKYLAHGHATLLGSNPVERAQVNQWTFWSLTTALPESQPAAHAVHGWGEITQPSFDDSVSKIRKNASDLNTHLNGKKWLVGDNVTLADITVACHLIISVQNVLDASFRKSNEHFARWFKSVIELPAFVSVVGNLKVCEKATTP